MRLTIDPIYLGDVVQDRMTRLDQLTVVRNYVRKAINGYRKDAEGRKVEEIEVEVGWLDGDVEMLVFDMMVGWPVEIDGKKSDRNWYAEWRAETLAQQAT